MIAVDVENPIKVRAAGIRLLNEGLGPDVAREFMNQYFGGVGDYTAEKKALPPWTDADYEETMAFAEAEAESEMWRGNV